MALTALGGLGIFLAGMIIMTDTLKVLAGERIRAALIRFTRTPASGAVTGALCTAVIQSSSATTVTAVSFVGAELMSFASALGIIFGANLGTTITGWMVVLIGFKLQLGTMLLPVVLVGVLVRFMGSSKWGMVLIGFGLIFVGLDFMQAGLGELLGIVDFEKLPGNTFMGRILLLLIGLLFTLITRSSSAGVAATLTALFAGIIEFEQAAALVIGMDLGTSTLLVRAIRAVTACIGAGDWRAAQRQATDARQKIDESVEHERDEVILSMGIGVLDMTAGTLHLEAIRWLQRVSHHLAGITTHQWQANLAAGGEMEESGQG